MFFLECLFNLLDQFRVLFGYVFCLSGVRLEIVELDGGIFVFTHLELDRFPLAFFSKSEGTFSTLLQEFPVKVGMFFLVLFIFTKKRWEVGNAIETIRCRGAADLTQGREYIPMG